MTLDPSSIVRGLAEAGVPWRVVCLDECGSTNREALDRAAADPELAREGVAVFAEWQSAGRGRRGARWASPRSRDLLFSVAFRPQLAVERWSRLTHAAALAVCRALEPGFAPRIKWPNDVYLSGRKVAGILLESQGSGEGDGGVATIGIGLNVNASADDFPPDLAAPATSLWLESGSPAGGLDREELAVELLAALHRSCAAADDFAPLRASVESRSMLIGEQVELTLPSGELVRGRASGFGDEGELLVHDRHSAPHRIASASMVRLTSGPVDDLEAGAC